MTNEGHVKRDFGGSMGVVETGILQAWRGRDQEGGIKLWK